MKKKLTVNISAIENPEGNYRYQVSDLAFQAMMRGEITVDDWKWYEDWFWELAKSNYESNTKKM